MKYSPFFREKCRYCKFGVFSMMIEPYCYAYDQLIKTDKSTKKDCKFFKIQGKNGKPI